MRSASSNGGTPTARSCSGRSPRAAPPGPPKEPGYTDPARGQCVIAREAGGHMTVEDARVKDGCMILDSCSIPIVLAPLAGGPSTPDLAAAVSNAGGLGFLASGYLSAAELADRRRRLDELTGRPFGVNLFVPGLAGDVARVRQFAAEIEADVSGVGARLGEPMTPRRGSPGRSAAGPRAGSRTASCAPTRNPPQRPTPRCTISHRRCGSRPARLASPTTSICGLGRPTR
jgi:Nitronate monooxygenase